MSLRVWLPLTKDLRNQGLDDITVTNNGATFNSAGKLGGCYSFNRSTPNYLKITNPLTTATNGVSMAFWVKLPSNGSVNDQLVHIGNGSGWTNNRFTCFVRGGNSTLIFACGDGTNSTQYSCTSSALTLNQWIHVVCLYENNKMKIYLNGALDKEYSTTIVPSFTNVTYVGIGAGPNVTEPATAYLNDIRIYDHALSPLEVKQISQGLILHYPLNRNGWGNENLLKYTQVNALNKNLLRTNISTIWDKLTLTTKDGYDCYLYPMAQSSTWFNSSTWYRLKANTVYTYSAYIYFTQNANFSFSSLGHFQVYNSASTASDKSHEDIRSARIYEPSTIQANKWTKIRITFTTNNLADSGFVIYPRYNISTNVGDLYIRNFKLEEGDKATPWCPNSSDKLYSTLGLNDNIQYDTSGYGNNGTRIGTFSWTNDTPKYQVSSIFDSSSIIDTPVIITSNDLISQYTAAVWIKRNNTDTTNLHCFFTGPIELFIQGSTSRIRFYWSHATSTSSMENNTWDPSVTINNSIWTHIVVTFADGVLKCYINGELSNTSDRSSTGQYIYGNKYHTIGSYHDTTEKFIGQICDVRAYATALSAEDVKSLYNNSAYIDNQGNIYGAVYEEV